MNPWVTELKDVLILSHVNTFSASKNSLTTYGQGCGFPGGSDDKESICNAGDPSSILASGRSPVEGNGNPLQYSWASLVAQMIKNPSAMQETWV